VVVGCAVVLWRRGSRGARLHSLAVAPWAQGAGVGTRLLSACEQVAAAAGCVSMRLEVRAANVTARAFYRRRGYRVVASLPGYYPDGANGARMSRALGIGWQPLVAVATRDRTTARVVGPAG
jgi:ribosomal-protein-alanine N-acetyltransferase